MAFAVAKMTSQILSLPTWAKQCLAMQLGMPDLLRTASNAAPQSEAA
jgi:hypothetical protein